MLEIEGKFTLSPVSCWDFLQLVFPNFVNVVCRWFWCCHVSEDPVSSWQLFFHNFFSVFVCANDLVLLFKVLWCPALWQEAVNINQSLFVLRRVITALSRNADEYLWRVDHWPSQPTDLMDVSKNRGTPKWIVYNGKPYKNWWFGGTIILGNTLIDPSFPKKTTKMAKVRHVPYRESKLSLGLASGWKLKKLTWNTPLALFLFCLQEFGCYGVLYWFHVVPVPDGFHLLGVELDLFLFVFICVHMLPVFSICFFEHDKFKKIVRWVQTPWTLLNLPSSQDFPVATCPWWQRLHGHASLPCSCRQVLWGRSKFVARVFTHQISKMQPRLPESISLKFYSWP